ncbi:hypothetical protein DFH09DRAFT_1305228 [Mycena vulgaris]|nr:hypothetical protein DFH09DRAFT_1305228 [Mycena vulgaris]
MLELQSALFLPSSSPARAILRAPSCSRHPARRSPEYPVVLPAHRSPCAFWYVFVTAFPRFKVYIFKASLNPSTFLSRDLSTPPVTCLWICPICEMCTLSLPISPPEAPSAV